ncbi:hypothetical protein EDF57_103576 [Novosphingobium sp. PhB55]|uniref:hypothetical protein n=1 Tax=Novosphingobium sp. PhB55 TaxID=2485106 RepID=UPI0010646D3A|nr:hypothetical protein [Novosphingobium sp. PhB55]TDW65392.1 hypothetical protein EDF57_103576 [Novosphingobium sp. PhB55]
MTSTKITKENLSPLWGLTIVQDQPGTVIRNARTGEELTVKDGCGVTLDGTVHLTPSDYAALCSRVGASA